MEVFQLFLWTNTKTWYGKYCFPNGNCYFILLMDCPLAIVLMKFFYQMFKIFSMEVMELQVSMNKAVYFVKFH